MKNSIELFSRNCTILTPIGQKAPLLVQFFQPVQNPKDTDYLAWANISCRYFSKDVYATGEDAAQAFFSLPNIIVSYLLSKRGDGFEIYWLEPGDLSYRDFWGYTK